MHFESIETQVLTLVECLLTGVKSPLLFFSEYKNQMVIRGKLVARFSEGLSLSRDVLQRAENFPRSHRSPCSTAGSQAVSDEIFLE
ncbi:hypothetical protein TNCV_1358381 [Trichonephila clavipes]|uniref:Uncharacterized protein n=1 Tax=Trichonephila clavipes TaxID=2585209 RepID=A0A8X6VDC0_TRICX|nr:hypothetical protein TNCV_1358381 [Trichonephila clavipes]